MERSNAFGVYFIFKSINAAVEAAKRAFAKWRLVPAPRRAEIVFRAAEILIERKE